MKIFGIKLIWFGVGFLIFYMRRKQRDEKYKFLGWF